MKRKLIIPTVVALFLVALGVYVYRYWYDGEHFVRTDNAYVSGSLVQAGSPYSGRVVSVNVEVGQKVEEGTVLAVVAAPVVSTLPGTVSSTPRYYATSNLTAEATAPISGIVVARPAAAGDTVSPGEAVATLVDPSALWVVANVEEGKVGRVKPGQQVEIHVDMLGRSLPGTVEAITPAAASLFSLMPAQNTTGNFTKVSQVVPVKIAVDYRGFTLYPGTSVGVSIRVKE